MKEFKIVKQNGVTEIFDPRKLVDSLQRVGTSESVAEAIVREVESGAFEGMTTNDIYTKAFEILHNAQRRIAARYSVRRAIIELGPTGFPFEKFISHIFSAEGYQTMTDQMMVGECAEHEVDVVAFNDKELIAVEVKFHNELGIKSDLKVALYIKARIDDLKDAEHMIHGEKRKLTNGWLITNTKFTQSAINYALCKNLNLIGWNYPTNRSLEDLIIKYNLYPITCLTSLDAFDRKTLIEKGLVLVSDIQNDPNILKDIGKAPERVQHILDEIAILFSKQ